MDSIRAPNASGAVNRRGAPLVGASRLFLDSDPGEVERRRFEQSDETTAFVGHAESGGAESGALNGDWLAIGPSTSATARQALAWLARSGGAS